MRDFIITLVPSFEGTVKYIPAVTSKRRCDCRGGFLPFYTEVNATIHRSERDWVTFLQKCRRAKLLSPSNGCKFIIWLGHKTHPSHILPRHSPMDNPMEGVYLL